MFSSHIKYLSYLKTGKLTSIAGKFFNIFKIRENKCSRNFQILPIAKFAKINVRENLCSRKLMFAKYNVLKVNFD